MKINCMCGKEFDFATYTFPEGDKEFIRRPCPNCRRAYELRVTLVQENTKFWTL